MLKPPKPPTAAMHGCPYRSVCLESGTGVVIATWLKELGYRGHLLEKITSVMSAPLSMTEAGA